jgi:DNA mismatch repair protein MutL
MTVNRIHALSEDCINKIAAGEVIERPASLLKELVENSLDAGATRIVIQIEEGGKSLLRIQDNGSGISPEDLDICWLRYTTSKIREASDLADIQTNGFRGEALSSIAAVSHFTIESKIAQNDVGYKLEIQGGQKMALSQVPREVGTTMTVQNLFYNMPVRAKFLASSQTETNRITTMLTRFALAHPEVSFSLKQGSKELLDYKGVASEHAASNRIADVFGSGLARELKPFDVERKGVRVYGFLASPQADRAKRGQQHFYLGKRPIWNGVLIKALEQGYSMMYPGHFPVAIMFIEVPAGSVDVNVHPTKHEVRFADSLEIFSVISGVVREVLIDLEKAPRIYQNSENVNHQEQASSHFHSPSRNATSSSLSGPLWTEIPASEVKSARQSFQNFDYKPQLFKEKPSPERIDSGDLFENIPQNVVHFGAEQFKEVHKNHLSQESENRWAPKIQLLQIHQTYIVMETQTGLALIDQQRAHERILYEGARKNLEMLKSLPSKQLLFPETLELSAEEMRLLGDHTDRFLALGFDLEIFGMSCYQMRGIPLEMEPEAAKVAVIEMLSDLKSEKLNADTVREAMAKSFAKRTALRNGTPMSSEEMSFLIDQLFSPLIENPYVSPFGKPIVIKMGREELDKKFSK